MPRHALSALVVVALATASVLVPSTASAKAHSFWSTPRSEHARTAAKAVDADLTWTVLEHEVVVTTPTLVVVPFVYTCGTKAEPKRVEVDPAAFQDAYADPELNASAFVPEKDPSPTFTCDGAQHVQDVVLTEVDGAFDYGTVEVGLSVGSGSTPTFEHAIVGYGVRDGKAPVTVTVNAFPEPAKVGETITVKGTVRRDGKAYAHTFATLYFQADGSSAVKVGSDRASSHGNLKTTVQASRSGSFFWATSPVEDRHTRAGASYGDHVLVTK